VGFQLSGLCERCTVQLLPARTENRFSNGSLFARGRRVNTRALHSLASALALTSKLPPRPGGSNSLSKRTVNTEPLPGSLVAVTSPPIMRASLRVMARPSPVPPKR
jgi:hypothetical protein